jgi:hypothetical protein
VADVGDGDDQAAAAGVRLGKNGIVEVARVLAVDRDERQRAQVLAAGAGGGVHLAAERARLCERRGRKLVREPVRRDREVDRRVRAAAFGERAQHAPHRVAVAARLLGDLDHGDVAVARGTRGVARHHHALADAAIVRRHEADSALEREAAGDLARAPFEHLDDRARRPAVLVLARDPRGRAVAVEKHAHLAVRQVHVVAAVVRNEETEAVAMTARGADDDGQRSTRQYSFARLTSSSPSRDMAASRLRAPSLPPGRGCRAASRARRTRAAFAPRAAWRAGARGSGSALRSARIPRESAGLPAASVACGSSC